jgi:hypothetical protein
MSTRALFVCNSVEDFGQSKKVKLAAVYEGELSDDERAKRFTKATPWGELAMTIDNPDASVQFVPGKRYWLDVSEVDPPAAEG